MTSASLTSSGHFAGVGGGVSRALGAVRATAGPGGGGGRQAGVGAAAGPLVAAAAHVPNTSVGAALRADGGAAVTGDSQPGAGDGGAAPRKAITIGAVCKALVQEFPDISISKIRYLEDQKLLSPRRTAGGYRVYSQADVERLRTILRMQRDEFLPLRVIRQELTAGRVEQVGTPPRTSRDGARAWSSATSVTEPSGALYSLEDVMDDTQVEAKLVAELEEYGVVHGQMRGGVRYFDETEREIIRAVTELARYGVGGRNLRVFRSSADREASLLQQILAPSLRSRNPERRREAVQALENLAAVATHLKHLLLIRDLRKIAN